MRGSSPTPALQLSMPRRRAVPTTSSCSSSSSAWRLMPLAQPAAASRQLPPHPRCLRLLRPPAPAAQRCSRQPLPPPPPPPLPLQPGHWRHETPHQCSRLPSTRTTKDPPSGPSQLGGHFQGRAHFQGARAPSQAPPYQKAPSLDPPRPQAPSQTLPSPENPSRGDMYLPRGARFLTAATMHHRGIFPGKLPPLLKSGPQAIVVVLARSILPCKMPSCRPVNSTHCPPSARATQQRQVGSAQAGGTQGTQLPGRFTQLPCSFHQGRRPAALRACRCSSPPTQRSPTPAPHAASKRPWVCASRVEC